MPRSVVSVLGLALVLAATPLTAQTQPPSAADDPTRFQTDIVVTPERGDASRAQVPAATTVLDAATLKTLPAVSLGEALSFIPGFQIERGAFHAGLPLVSARGFFGGGEADYVLLLVDGVPTVDAESGLADWSVVSLASIRRIEANRGPGASMYGDAAVGGVIQILTDRNGHGGDLTTTVGGFGTLTVDGVDRRQFTKTTAQFSGTVRRTSGFSDHSAADYLTGTAGLEGRVGQSLWRVSGSGNRRATEDPGALTLDQARSNPGASDPLSRFDELHRHGGAGAFTLQRTSDSWGYQTRLYGNMRDEDMTRTILLAPALGDRQARALTANAIGGSAEGERRTGDAAHGGVIRFGVDVSRERIQTAYSPVDDRGIIGAEGPEESGHRARAGIFASSGWNVAPRVRVSGAVRWDHVADDAFGTAAGATHDAWSPRLGVTVGVNDARGISVFSQVSKAFKVPTLNQLFDPRPYPDFQGGSFTISNRALVPQRATNLEAGVQGGSRRLHWSALGYRMHVDDEIDFDSRTFSYANIGESRHTGVEIELAGRLGWLQPSVSYALTRVGTGGDLQLKNVPRHTLNLAADVDLVRGLAANLRYRRTGGAFLDDENAIAIDGPSALDLRLRRLFGRQLVFVDAINLTNDRYQEYGFTLTDFRGVVVPYAYPGAPRAVRVGITVSF